MAQQHQALMKQLDTTKVTTKTNKRVSLLKFHGLAGFFKNEKIFLAMSCLDKLKVMYASYMLVGEAEYWWQGSQQLMEPRGEVVSCFFFVETRRGDNIKHHLLTSHRFPKQ
ncbi:hypothetical protein CR513_07280, partial [Mucuna pruriens]